MGREGWGRSSVAHPRSAMAGRQGGGVDGAPPTTSQRPRAIVARGRRQRCWCRPVGPRRQRLWCHKKNYSWNKFFQGSLCKISFRKGPNRKKSRRVVGGKIS